MATNTLSLPSEKTRLTLDIEFVQMLANVEYVVWLAKEGYLSNDLFVNYLEALLYLQDPSYMHLMIYPMGISALKVLVNEGARKAIVSDPDLCRSILAEQVYSSWANKEEVVL